VCVAPGVSEEGLGAGGAAGELLLEQMAVLEIPACAQVQKDAHQAPRAVFA